MKLIPVKVECHSGYKADEYPVSYILEGMRIEIREITDRWYQSEPDPLWPVSDYFKVCTSGGHIHILKHDLEDDAWYLCG
jgi:hypothetical protein